MKKWSSKVTTSRKTALAVGVLFILTFITSIGAVLAYGNILSDPGYITGSGPSTGVFLGAFLELFLIVTNIGCAVVLFPLLKRTNEALALAYVAERIVEGTFILIGLLSLLTIVTLRQTAAGTDAGAPAGGADVLAGESGGDQVHGGDGGPVDPRQVPEVGDAGKPGGQDGAGVPVGL